MYNSKHNCIFVRVPRTGTGSLGTMLGLGGGHMEIQEIKRRFIKNPPTRKKWEQVFKFGFVRNPYTRFVSAYYNIHYDEKKGDINRFIQNKDNMDRFWKEELVLVKPMVDYLCINGEIAVDYLGRFEDLHNCWNHLFEKFGIDEDQRRLIIKHYNRTSRPKQELDDISRQILYEIYKKDFEMFGYMN